jgi:hypothetical protein
MLGTTLGLETVLDFGPKKGAPQSTVIRLASFIPNLKPLAGGIF